MRMRVRVDLVLVRLAVVEGDLDLGLLGLEVDVLHRAVAVLRVLDPRADHHPRREPDLARLRLCRRLRRLVADLVMVRARARARARARVRVRVTVRVRVRP